MKKITFIIPTTLLSIILGVTFTFAGNPSFVGSIQGDPSPSTLTASDSEKETSDTYTENTIRISPDVPIDFIIDGDTERAHVYSNLTMATRTSITSQDDLENYSKTLIHNNKDIVTVAVEDDRIAITRTISAKLFWIFSIPVKETAEVISWGDETNQIRINRSWWNIFSKNEIPEKEVQDTLRLRIKSIPISQFTTTLDNQTKATILSQIGITFDATSTVPEVTQ